jgi:hypothetical protein
MRGMRLALNGLAGSAIVAILVMLVLSLTIRKIDVLDWPDQEVSSRLPDGTPGVAARSIEGEGLGLTEVRIPHPRGRGGGPVL